eukprot:XP_011677982.1 PREDICTED: Golgi apparatus protein 1-like [Strongylocentrotus purpuratus]
MEVNDARKQLFAQKSRNLENIPPTQAALKQHIKRTCYQAICWNQTLTKNPEMPEPSDWGWTNETTGTLSCLMENIEDNQMMDNCAEKLLETQYFISRNYRLDPLLFKNCESDASIFCWEEKWNGKEETPSGLVFSCLHRHLHDHSQPLQSRCADQVHRVLRQRAVSVHLNPRIEENCRVDLGAHCNDKTKIGEFIPILLYYIVDLS